MVFTRSLGRNLAHAGFASMQCRPAGHTDRQLRQYVTPAIKRFVRKITIHSRPIQPAEIAAW